MARVTIEDCTLKIPSRFELVVLAAHRAREIASGARPTIERDKDKNPVIALREIAEGTVTVESLKESLLKKHQKFNPSADVDLPEEDDVMDLSSEIVSEIKSLTSSVEDDEALSDMYSDSEIDCDED